MIQGPCKKIRQKGTFSETTRKYYFGLLSDYNLIDYSPEIKDELN